MRTLAEAIHALERSSKEAAASGSFEPMRRVIAMGVSANLCEALVGLHESSGEQGLDFAFSWAPSRPPSQPIPSKASLAPDVIDVLRETARVFRETETAEGVEVLGMVNRLDHIEEDRGRAKIVGLVDGSRRNVAVELVGPNHSLAVRSYEERLPLSCVGELERDGRSWVLRNPREVVLILGN
jgi:hypothetical protein